MELKQYQKKVIADVSRFLELLTQRQKIAEAYEALWTEKNVMVGHQGMPTYRSVLPGIPSVCLKVPTGGGKTFISCCCIKPIFDSMEQSRSKAVVWLVPSDSILEQTYKALCNPSHPYRQRIEADFNGRVEIYSKDQLLNGQNFSPTSIMEQLSIFVLSYDSFRTGRKEGRKAYQENGYMLPFVKYLSASDSFLPDADATASIQVIRALNPLVIVDESHHATSSLSIDMLQNFNPCFILDLTATPHRNSNIISFVDAAQLKKENMVKLPVIVYNRKTQEDVFSDAISIRAKLEAQAKNDQMSSGRYIRPIVLFQAQPKTSEDSTTFAKIKHVLMEYGIPADQIAIKTADINELRNVDLMSPQCQIRFIITVNALKEGWDCPFAYVLATVANRTSAVDVEQILGRVLRLPYASRNASGVLNISYVLTSTNDFHSTLEKVVVGLNGAGFSSKDYYAKDDSTGMPSTKSRVQDGQIALDTGLEVIDGQSEYAVAGGGTWRNGDETTAGLSPVVPSETGMSSDPGGLSRVTDIPAASDELLDAALVQNDAYEKAISGKEETALDLAPQEVRGKMNAFRMNDIFCEEAGTLRIPQFMIESGPSLFSDTGVEPLQLEHLASGFTLKDKDVQIDFSTMGAEMARVDVEETGDSTPKAWKLSGMDSTFFMEWFASLPSNRRLDACKHAIHRQISKIDSIEDEDLSAYINRIVETLNEDQLAELERSPFPFSIKIKAKVQSMLAIHAMNMFKLWLEQNRITCQPHYRLPSIISPVEHVNSIPKSLYSDEERMNEFEFRVVWEIASLDNVKWWHRNISRLGFCINGPLNAYPDLIVMTTSGKLLMVETKGDHLENAESEQKALIGSKWAAESGKQHRYFMVFDKKQPPYPGAYSLDRFMAIIRGL